MCLVSRPVRLRSRSALSALPFPSVEILGITWSCQDHGDGGVWQTLTGGGLFTGATPGQETGGREQDAGPPTAELREVVMEPTADPSGISGAGGHPRVFLN